MIKNKYIIETNADGYVSGFYSVLDGEYNFYGQMALYLDCTLGYTKFIADDSEARGHFEIDEEKKAEILHLDEVKKEIADLKEKLSETDYIFAKLWEDITNLNNALTFITDFIKLLVQFAKDYKETIANRKTWRERIKELENEN